MSPKEPESEPPSSFPGIWKFPTSRELSFSPIGWMSGKVQDDNIGQNLWRVHDKLYDLQKFIKFHPGGSEWLEITRGTDVTEAFESSHLVHPEWAEETLAKCYVRDAEEKRLSPFTFKDDGFYRVLKRRIRPILKEVGTGPSMGVKLLQDSLVLLSLAASVYATMTNSILHQIMTGVILSMTITMAHNFVHLKENWRKYYFDLGMLSSFEFRISHNLSHHLYPNTLMDYEITMFEPMFMILPKSPKNWIQRYGPYVYSTISYIFLFYWGFTSRWIGILRGKQKFRPENLITLIHLLMLAVFAAPDLQTAVTSWLTIHAAASYFFVIVGFNAGHHDVDAVRDGDEIREDPDFGLCQLDALVPRSSIDCVDNQLLTIMTTFGEHSMHHLFPTICHSKIRHIKPIVMETLKEFSEELRTKNHVQLFLGSLKQMKTMEPKKRISKNK